MNERRHVGVFAAALFAGVVVAGAAAEAADPIKIAYLSPLSGRLESYGKTQQFVIGIALDEINKAGGINGAPLQLIVEDTAFDPKQAVEKVRKVVERDNVPVVFGPYGSGEMDVVAPLAVQLQVPMVSTVFTKIGVPAANRPWVFRIGPNDSQVIESGIAAYRKLFPNAKKVAMIGNAGEPYVAATLKEYLPAAFKKHGFELVETVEITTGQVDYAPSVNRLARANADFIMVQAIAGELAGVMKEIARQGLKDKAVVAGLQGTWAGPWVKIAAQDFEGTYAIASFFTGDTRPKAQALVKAFDAGREAAGVKLALTVEPAGYDALHAIAKVMRNAKITAQTPVKDARAKIRDGLAGLKGFDGATGTLAINKDGDAEGFVFRVLKAKNADWTLAN